MLYLDRIKIKTYLFRPLFMIRRILLIILIPVLAITAISCDDLEDNNPALQVMVNGELFKADEMQVATEEDGDGYILTGINEDSSLSIYLTDIAEDSYSFGENSENTLSLITEGKEFTTTNENGSGVVIISDSSKLDYITGTFNFLATDTSGTKLHGANGHIYQVAFGSSDLDIPDLEINNAVFKVGSEDVEVDEVKALYEDSNIEISIIGADSQRISIVLPDTIEDGEIDLPNADVSFAYLLDGDTFNVVSGTLQITAHDTDLQVITASFNVITEGEYEVSGSFQVAY